MRRKEIILEAACRGETNKEKPGADEMPWWSSPTFRVSPAIE
jgi:hypothetical protein